MADRGRPQRQVGEWESFCSKRLEKTRASVTAPGLMKTHQGVESTCFQNGERENRPGGEERRRLRLSGHFPAKAVAGSIHAQDCGTKQLMCRRLTLTVKPDSCSILTSRSISSYLKPSGAMSDLSRARTKVHKSSLKAPALATVPFILRAIDSSVYNSPRRGAFHDHPSPCSRPLSVRASVGTPRRKSGRPGRARPLGAPLQILARLRHAPGRVQKPRSRRRRAACGGEIAKPTVSCYNINAVCPKAAIAQKV